MNRIPRDREGASLAVWCSTYFAWRGRRLGAWLGAWLGGWLMLAPGAPAFSADSGTVPQSGAAVPEPGAPMGSGPYRALFRAFARGMLHEGTYLQRNGGEFAGIAVGWLNWQLKGDGRAAHLFVGADCGLCVNPHWVVRSKHLH